MAGRLTQRLAEAARTQQGQLLIRDREIRGFALRVTANGCKTWVWDGRIHGRMHRITIGRYPDLKAAEARAKALKIRHDIAIGLDPARERKEKREEFTLADLAKLYLENHARVHKRSWREDERAFRVYFDSVRFLKLSAVDRDTISHWHRRIGDQRGRHQANRCLALLSAIYSWAIRLDYWHLQNPAKGIPHFPEESRCRFLNAEELSRLWATLDTEPSLYWRAYFRLALLLGMRKNEILRAKWKDVNLADGVWRLPHTKAKRPHTLPIPKAALEILNRLPSRGVSEWLLPSERRLGKHIADANHAWQRIRQRAGIPDVRIHDLRRTLGSWLAAQGCSLPLIGKTLNHADVSTTQIYARLDLEPVRRALEHNAALMLPQKSN